MSFEEFEEGERILFNDRKTPLNIFDIGDERMLVEGPSGGEYEIYFDGDTRLVAKPGNRKYSSYCKDLRKVGEWVREEEKWIHSKTEASIEVVEKDNGFWTIKSEKFEDELDLPMYGYSSKEFALEDVQKFIEKRPEG